MLAHALRHTPFPSLLARLAWQPDQWIRIATTLSLTGAAESVLDVGGRGRQMQALTRARVTTVNIEPPADIIHPKGAPLPLPDRSFDVVTACDVLEHIAAPDRTAFLRELIRVADRRVVLCFPHGSPENVAAERELRDLLEREFAVRFGYLEEHVAMGLPDTATVADELAEMAPGWALRVWWSHERPFWDACLLDAVRARHELDFRALLRFARVWLRPRRTAHLRSRAGSDAHRAYLVLTRQSDATPH